MKIRDYTVCLLLAGVLAVSASAAMSDFSIGSPGIIYNASESLNPCPVIADNGSWICCFGERGDAAPGGRILFVQSLTGQTWTRNISADKTSKHGLEIGSMSGYLSKAPNGDLVLAATDVNAVAYPSTWLYTSEVEIYVNSENSAIFPQTPLAVLPTNPVNGSWPSAPVRFLSNGDWILPGYYRDNANGGNTFPCGFWRSSDNGATWGAHELAFPVDWHAYNEIDIVERADHSLLAVARVDTMPSGFGTNGQLFYAESFNFGDTWTAPQLMGIPGHSPALIRWGDSAVMLGCRRLSASGNWTSVYIAEDGVNFQFAFDAIDPMGSRNSATGYPVFTKINGQNIYMAYYAGSDTLTGWPSTTYCAGNIIHDDMGLLECGDYGYLTADLSRDCYVSLLDFAALADNWLASTMP